MLLQQTTSQFFKDSVEAYAEWFIEEWVLSHALAEEYSTCNLNIEGGEMEVIINDPDGDATGTIYTFIYNSELDRVSVYETQWRFTVPADSLKIKRIPVKTLDITECFWRHVCGNQGSYAIRDGLLRVLRDNEEMRGHA